MINYQNEYVASLDNINGFTLIEVLIALAIFSVGILGVAALQTNSISGNTTARGVTDITVAVSDRLETLRGMPYNDADLSDGTHTPQMTADGIDNNYNGLIDESNETGPLSVQWVVTNDMPMKDAKTVVVTVSHTGSAVDKTVTIQGIIPEIN
jgi:prepilin-type N-terminal cleavage/methylation domain-containing protein